ncbi:DUF3788 family protein [Sunxiuqinia sp. A32]|uniref:DUF3788 family protein n=1 Tax=Sunxiuqinia sp. A32 TaxID=3461496 RepID=UPI0040454A1E
MEIRELTSEEILPTDEIVFSIIGDKEVIWEQTFSYLNKISSDITLHWNYYKDGKVWMLKTLRKKKTLFWIRLLNSTFRIAFWFAEKYEKEITKSDLSEKLKHDYLNAQAFNRSRCIYIDVESSDDLEEIKKLIDLKLKLK